MTDYDNGFYIYTPNKSTEEDMHELSIPQVIQIIEGEVWLTGVSHDNHIDYVEAVGTIGKMVMDEEGQIK